MSLKWSLWLAFHESSQVEGTNVYCYVSMQLFFREVKEENGRRAFDGGLYKGSDQVFEAFEQLVLVGKKDSLLLQHLLLGIVLRDLF